MHARSRRQYHDTLCMKQLGGGGGGGVNCVSCMDHANESSVSHMILTVRTID